MKHSLETADWLLKHGEETLQDLQNRISPHYNLLPDFAYEMFIENYENEAYKILKETVQKSLNINAEEMLLFFNKQYVIMVLGREILCPPKK